METEKSQICSTCPRACKIDRNLSLGFCKESNLIRIAKIIEHFTWEEPCVTGEKGTLAIFFSGCNLRCDYCQNYEISHIGKGKTYTIEEFANLIVEKQKNHSSIDLITPTHFSKQLKQAFSLFKKTIPVIWNTNSYETLENIENVGTFVDIFLADLKYSNDELGAKFSACKDYFSVALPAIKKMCELKKDVITDDFMQQGVIIRHLVLPGYIQNSLNTLDIINENFPTRKVSVMSQFTPNGHSTLTRKLTPIEYKIVVKHLENLEISNGYIQDFDSANDIFVPNFE